MSSIVNNNAAGVVGTTDHLAKTAAKVMVTADALFTAVGDVQILSLHSECYSANGATASTLQYKLTPTTGTLPRNADPGANLWGKKLFSALPRVPTSVFSFQGQMTALPGCGTCVPAECSAIFRPLMLSSPRPSDI
jgi:hypothetical protein